MALRIKSHWNQEADERAPAEIAGALAFIAWRIALDKAVCLHCARFVYDNDRQRLAVIREYLIFLMQIADRLAAARMEEGERRVLITALAKKLLEHFQDNSQDLLGPDDYGHPFLAILNARSAEYAGFQFDDEGPSYAFLRHLGFEIQALMGSGQENRWVIDQVMDQDGQEAYRDFARAFANLFE